VRLLNVPDITDLEKLVEFFVAQGSRITWDRAKGEMRIDHAGFDTNQLKTEMPVGMRSTVLLFAPLLWRMKKIVIPASPKAARWACANWILIWISSMRSAPRARATGR